MVHAFNPPHSGCSGRQISEWCPVPPPHPQPGPRSEFQESQGYLMRHCLFF